MALSMDEQRILDEIERGLASADPVLATRMATFGAPRRIVALRMRRLRLVASLMTLVVVAMVSVLVYALVPFRSGADRHAGTKASSSPAQPVMTTPSHAAQSHPAQSSRPSPAGPVPAGPVSAGPVPAGRICAGEVVRRSECRARERDSREHRRPRLSGGERGGQPGAEYPGRHLGQPGRASAGAEHARPVGRSAPGQPAAQRARGPVLRQAGQFSRQNCSRYCSSPSRFFLACWNSSLSGSTPRSNISSYSRMTSRRLRA